MILIVLILSLADALRKNSEEAAERMFKQDSSSTLISYGKYMTYIFNMLLRVFRDKTQAQYCIYIQVTGLHCRKSFISRYVYIYDRNSIHTLNLLKSFQLAMIHLSVDFSIIFLISKFKLYSNTYTFSF